MPTVTGKSSSSSLSSTGSTTKGGKLRIVVLFSCMVTLCLILTRGHSYIEEHEDQSTLVAVRSKDNDGNLHRTKKVLSGEGKSRMKVVEETQAPETQPKDTEPEPLVNADEVTTTADGALQKSNSGRDNVASSGLLRPKLETTLTQLEGVKDDKTFKQLHHGIYRVVSEETEVKYAFKTECRPAAKWHGQQGWAEVAAHSFAKILFRELAPRVMVPFARGVFATMTSSQLSNTVHKDQCGVISEEQIIAAFLSSTSSRPNHQRETKSILERAQRLSSSSSSEHTTAKRKPLVGVGLLWQETHDDSSYPAKTILSYFNTNTKGAGFIPDSPGARHTRDDIASISDILLFDYLLANPDREEKNWFTVADNTNGNQGKGKGRVRIAMDNGWMFAGADYQGSVCSDMEGHLKCPQLFRYLSSGGKLGKGKCSSTTEFCRFRASTVSTIKSLVKEWRGSSSSSSTSTTSFLKKVGGDNEGGVVENDNPQEEMVGRAQEEKSDGDVGKLSSSSSLAQQWLDVLRQDPLLRFMLSQYNTVENKSGGKRKYSQALARYIHGCPALQSSSSSPLPPDVQLGYLAFGIDKRLKKLNTHIDSCISRHGEDYVLI